MALSVFRFFLSAVSFVAEAHRLRMFYTVYWSTVQLGLLSVIGVLSSIAQV